MELKKLTSEEAVAWLSKHRTELEYSLQYLDGRLNTINISIILDNGKEVGFIDSKIIQKEDLSSHDDHEFIQGALRKGQSYFYVETLNLLSTFQRKGFGKELVSSLKNSVSEPILVYVTAESFEFWYDHGFKGIHDDDYWLYWKELLSKQAIA